MPSERPFPILVIVGGVNGSGKTTFAKNLAGSPQLLGQTALNPDDLTQEVLAEYEKLGKRTDLGASPDLANLVAVERVEKLSWRAIAEGKSVAVETVLSSPKFFPLVQAARKRGFHVRLVFVALPTVEQAIERVAVRVKLGKHSVPEHKIRERWPRSHENLIRFYPLVDDIVVFSNFGTPTVCFERIGIKGQLVRHDELALPEVTKRFKGM